MVEVMTTRDPSVIEDWILEHGGRPAREQGTFGELRVDFEDADTLEELEWGEFFDILESEGLAMEYTEEGEMHPSEKYDFVKAEDDLTGDIETELDDEEVMNNVKETE